ncbi:hypothetical protein DMW20_11890 [Vibrio parahaemolyticus]|nr:hypothetical protein [Vibrio parahaemolyticus]
MRDQNEKAKPRAEYLLMFLGLGYSILSGVGKVGDKVEMFLSFFSSLLMFAAIILLAFKVAGKKVMNHKAAKTFGIVFVSTTVVEAVYPALIYSDQGTPTAYWMILFIQVAINAYIAEVIKS